jgi:hypothetical protein
MRMAGTADRPMVMGRASRCRSGKSTFTTESLRLKADKIAVMAGNFWHGIEVIQSFPQPEILKMK